MPIIPQRKPTTHKVGSAALARARAKHSLLLGALKTRATGSDSQRVAAFKLQVRMEQERDRHALEMRLAREKLESEQKPVTDEALKETAKLMRSIQLPPDE